MKRSSTSISANQISENIAEIKKIIPKNTFIMGVVKSDAYGHGIDLVLPTLIDLGIDYLAVASLDEAIKIRSINQHIPLLILSEFYKDNIEKIIQLKITQTIYSHSYAQELNNIARKYNVKIPVHIKVDTGMNRVGINVNAVYSLIDFLKSLDHIEIEGIYSHLACANQVNHAQNDDQINSFTSLLDTLASKNIHIKFKHLANTAGMISYPSAHFNMVRVGWALFKNVITLKSYITFIKTVPTHQPISYDSLYITSKDSKIATVCAGYADGVPRSLANIGYVIINDKQCPIVGTICMDMFMVDITSLNAPAQVGDPVHIIGYHETLDDEQVCSVDYISKLTGLNPREITCRVGIRSQRDRLTESV
tara:strand:+ start:2334 stop:3428 length:1095 start_codon:yes stop_codon:yes gene_type:complete